MEERKHLNRESEDAMDEQIVKFAVVGCGNIGSRHLAVVDAEPRARLVGICDIDGVKRRRYRSSMGASRRSTVTKSFCDGS